MEEQQDLNAAIAYFESQSDLSPFAAQVAKWLTELKRQSATIKSLKSENETLNELMGIASIKLNNYLADIAERDNEIDALKKTLKQKLK